MSGLASWVTAQERQMLVSDAGCVMVQATSNMDDDARGLRRRTLRSC